MGEGLVDTNVRALRDSDLAWADVAPRPSSLLIAFVAGDHVFQFGRFFRQCTGQLHEFICFAAELRNFSAHLLNTWLPVCHGNSILRRRGVEKG